MINVSLDLDDKKDDYWRKDPLGPIKKDDKRIQSFLFSKGISSWGSNQRTLDRHAIDKGGLFSLRPLVV